MTLAVEKRWIYLEGGSQTNGPSTSTSVENTGGKRETIVVNVSVAGTDTVESLLSDPQHVAMYPVARAWTGTSAMKSVLGTGANARTITVTSTGGTGRFILEVFGH